MTDSPNRLHELRALRPDGYLRLTRMAAKIDSPIEEFALAPWRAPKEGR